MKNLTNILSYLWLLLLMAVTACSDLEEEVGPMHVEEEVELTIQLHVPDMQASTREEMVITENISSIVAIAFDESDALIKKVDAILSGQDHVSHSGTLKIKVPKRTQTIHFLGNYTKNDIEKSITSLETLNNFTTTDDTTKPTMRYWGMTTFDGSNINQPVTLYRNMAKLTLKTGDGFTPNSCYIAGFVNRNISGTIVPSGYQVEDTPTIPNNVPTETHQKDNRLGNVYYLFEHANVENNNPLYVIIEVDDKYYKIAFASGDTYFPILRNRAYEITVTESLDEMYAETYESAISENTQPINNLVITNVPMTVTASPTEVLNESGQTFTVTITIPEGITKLNEPTHDAFNITPPNSLTPQNGKYTVTQGNYEFKFTVKEGVEAGDKTISFSGRGKYKSATGSATVNLYEIENVDLPITPDAPTVGNTKGSTTQLTVQIPDGITSLTITTDAFDVATPEGVTLENGTYNVSGKQGQSITFTLALKANGTANETKTVTFTGSGQKKTGTKEVTVTLAEKVLITAPGATEGVSNASVEMSYSNQSAIEEYTITVTVPDGVTQLNYSNNGFSNVYIDNNGWYNDAQSPINISDTKSIPLRLRVNKDYNSNPTITFSANNVESATFTVNRTEGSTDSNVLWEGALLFQGYNVHVSKIDIPNNLLQGKVFDGAVLTVEYEVINDNDDFLSIHGSGISNWANIGGMATDYTDNNTSTITMTLNSTIIENIGSSSINMQGYGRVLKKVTLTPPADVQFKVLEETISLDLATNETVLYVQKPANVTQLTITDNENLFGTVSTTFANANVNGKTINNLPNYAATIPVKLEITRVVDIKDYTIVVAGNDGSSDNVTINLLSTWSGSHSLGNWEGFWGSARKLPVGSTVQITFANYDNNCLFELHTYLSTDFGSDLRLEGYSTTEVENEDYISTSHLTNGVFTFTVATDGSVKIRNNGNLNNVTDAGLDGLQINGNNGLSITQVNITLGGGEITPTGFTYNFEDGVKLDGWTNLETEIVYDEVLKSNVLKLTVKIKNGQAFAQLGITGNYTGSYTLSLRYRIGTAEASDRRMNLVFQEGESEGYEKRATYSYTNISTSENTFNQQITLSGNVEQFVIQFEKVKENDIFYIDDLKLVKNN